MPKKRFLLVRKLVTKHDNSRTKSSSDFGSFALDLPVNEDELYSFWAMADDGILEKIGEK